MAPDPSVSIIVPARNEAGTIRRIVDELPHMGSRTEIIFVEGHSRDTTWDTITETARAYAGDHFIKYAKQDGIGIKDAIRKGFEMAVGDICIIYNADMSVPPEEVRPFFDMLRRGEAQFVNGTRFKYPMERGAMRPFNYIGNKAFSYVFRYFLIPQNTDTLCGTKALWKKDYERIKGGREYFGDFDPFGDFELLLGAVRLRLNIKEVPVHYRARVYGSTNISRWRHGWKLLLMTLLAIYKLKFQKVPGDIRS